ncbi:unnamed protein product [Trichobilharzia regenti]|nr:unnamed protein product [Trichobilharzia regenti]
MAFLKKSKISYKLISLFVYFLHSAALFLTSSHKKIYANTYKVESKFKEKTFYPNQFIVNSCIFILLIFLNVLVIIFAILFFKGTLAFAYREAAKSAKRLNFDSVRHWLFSGVDPSTSMVLLEDLAAVIGVLVAGSAMAATAYTGHVLPDAIGGICVSGILAAVAGLIIHTNTEMLIGR